MKKVIIIVVVLFLAGGGGFYYYSNYLRFTDDFTDCPVTAFRGAATSTESAIGFVTEDALVSLSFTEKCSLDCRNDNVMACVLYGLAMHKGVFVVQSDKESTSMLKRACDKGESLGCQFLEWGEKKAAEKAKAEAEAAAREANKEALEIIAKARGEAKRLRHEATKHFKGGTGPMLSASMLKWYNDTCDYLLYDKPLLSQMHRIPGVQVGKGLGFKEFVEAKYLGGEGKPDVKLVKEFLDKFKRLGVMQIKLDYRVEKKKERDLKKTHGYFRAKHTFLYNEADVETQIFEALEKALVGSS
ncbi:MAG: hypothetical protein GY854_30150 [Deltaproteobacteria bacterium]|nr:hypothetical protein [Deltaproteobacteria bacterium]